MNREQFNQALQAHLSSLPKSEIEKSLTYFNEMIDDRIEDGMTEEEAIADLGNVREIAEKIIAEEPLMTKVKGKLGSPGNIGALGWILIILGSPLWLSLLLGAAGIAIALLVVAFVPLIIAVAFVTTGIVMLVTSPIAFSDNLARGLWLVGTGLFLSGFGLILYCGFVSLWKWLRQKFSKFRR